MMAGMGQTAKNPWIEGNDVRIRWISFSVGNIKRHVVAKLRHSRPQLLNDGLRASKLVLVIDEGNVHV